MLNVATRGGHESGVPESTPAGFCVFLSGPVSSEISDLCEISDLLLFQLFCFSE